MVSRTRTKKVRGKEKSRCTRSSTTPTPVTREYQEAESWKAVMGRGCPESPVLPAPKYDPSLIRRRTQTSNRSKKKKKNRTRARSSGIGPRMKKVWLTRPRNRAYHPIPKHQFLQSKQCFPNPSWHLVFPIFGPFLLDLQ